MPFLPRQRWLDRISAAIAHHPVTVLLGPRQCGKTTLARQVTGRRKVHWFDLEVASQRAALENPELALSELEGLVVVDEAQRQPALFAVLRTLVDRPGRRARFLLLASASPALVKGVTESLAGRAHFIELSGLGVDEVGADGQSRLWLRGGFPRSYLAASDGRSGAWRDDFMRSFFERDLPMLGTRVNTLAMRRFWGLLAHTHAQVSNASALARALGVTQPVAVRYLDLLAGTFLVRRLSPWFEDVGKRQVKSPKVYLRDSGLLHALLGVSSRADLLGRPQVGASWEGFALESIVSAAPRAQTYFWATAAGAELDLMLVAGARRHGFEFKVTDAPRMTKSIEVALRDLKLTDVKVVYPGTRRYRIAPKVEAVPLADAVAWAGKL